MRDPETDRLLTDVRQAVAAAREGGVTVRACIWDATWAAADSKASGWPSEEARHIADDACRAVEPPTVKTNPHPQTRAPLAARMLLALADRITARKARS